MNGEDLTMTIVVTIASLIIYGVGLAGLILACI